MINNIQPYNLNFEARKPRLTKKEVADILVPMFEQGLPYETIMRESGFSHNIITRCCKDVFGMSVNRYYKIVKGSLLKQEILNHHQNGKTIKEIGDSYNRSANWVYIALHKLKIKNRHQELQEKLDNNVLDMINKGWNTKKIAQELKCGASTIGNWIRSKLNMGITRYRHLHNIKLQRD